MVAMKACPSCGARSDDAARFCLECGYAYEASSAEVVDPWQGRMVAHRFRIVRKLGDGGMGEVFCAEQVPMGRQVAVKVLRQSLSDDPEQVARFKREAQAASQLRHPNTIIVHDFGQDEDGTLFLAMELLEGEPLADVLEREGTLDPERAARIMAQVCASLQEAHQRGMVHRDLKPENIFLTDRGSPDFVKVLDFGIAKVTQGSKGEKLESITRAGAVFGTPHYMSPEQIKGEELDARADVYALGVILYRMIAGHLPFNASTVMEMLTKHLTAEPAPIERSVGKGDQAARARLEAVALRALSKLPDQRQSSAVAFVEDLMAAMPGISLTSITGLTPVASVTPSLPVSEVARAVAAPVAKPIAALAATAGVAPITQSGPASTARPLATPSATPGVSPSATPSAMPSATPGAMPRPPLQPMQPIQPVHDSSGGGKGALIAMIVMLLLIGGGAAWWFAFGGQEMVLGTDDAGIAETDAGAADAKVAAVTPDAATIAVIPDAAAPPPAVPDAAAPPPAVPDAAAPAVPDAAAAAVPDAAAPAVPDAAAAPDPADAAARAAAAAAERAAAQKAAADAAAAQKAAADAAAAEAARQAALAAANTPAGFGRVLITTQSAGARIIIDGQPRGTTPNRTGIKLPAGKHTIEVIKGARRLTKTIELTPDEIERVSFAL